MAIRGGSWSIGGFKLPEFGITEAIGGALNRPKTAQGGSNVLGANTQRAQAPAPYKAPTVQYINGGENYPAIGTSGNPYSKTTGGGGSIPTNNVPTQGGGQPYQMINDQQNNGNSQIDEDYNQAMSMFDQAQSGLQSQAGTANAQISNDAAGVATSLGAEQSTKEQSTNTSLQTAETQGTSAMQQARDVFRQTQQQNNAQLSALGISSSSVAEALAERLGVDVARRIAGVTGSLQEVRQNTVAELGRIKNYYSEKKTQLDQNVQIQKQQIQQSLMQGLNQINSGRNQASAAKSEARANLLSQVQQQVYALTAQQQQFDQSLKQWAAQKSAALTPIAQDPNYLNTLMNTANTFNQKFAATGFSFTPEVSYDSKGQMTGKVVSGKKQEEDPLAALYAEAGIQ